MVRYDIVDGRLHKETHSLISIGPVSDPCVSHIFNNLTDTNGKCDPCILVNLFMHKDFTIFAYIYLSSIKTYKYISYITNRHVALC